MEGDGWVERDARVVAARRACEIAREAFEELTAELYELRRQSSRAAELSVGINDPGAAPDLVALQNRISRRLTELGPERARAEELHIASRLELRKIIDRVEDEDGARRDYWFRRFHTSLAIANGGAFAAVASHLFAPELTAFQSAAAFWPMTVFAAGLVAAGLIPMLLYARWFTAAWAASAMSAVLFCVGLISAVVGAWTLSQDGDYNALVAVYGRHPATSISSPKAGEQRPVK